MKKGFTLTELLTTVVILAVLAAVALPKFSKSTEKAKANQAIAYLRAIRVGEKMYFAKNNTYVACSGKLELQSKLGVEVTEENYKFTVVAGSPGIATTFEARSQKGTAAPTTCGTAKDAICVKQDGTWVENSAYVDGSKL